MSDAQERRLIVNDNVMSEHKISNISKFFILGTVTVVVWYIYSPSGVNWIKFRELIKTTTEKNKTE